MTIAAQTELSIRKRDGRTEAFDPRRIHQAVTAAMRAGQGASADDPVESALDEAASRVAAGVVSEVEFVASRGDGSVDVERVQDLVESQLMQEGEFRVARRYILYREQRSRARALRAESEIGDRRTVSMRAAGGDLRPVDFHDLKHRLFRACRGLPECSANELLGDTVATIYDGISESELERALVMAARQRIERDPAYSQAATRLLLDIVYKEAWGRVPEPTHDAPLPLFPATEGEDETATSFPTVYRGGFSGYLRDGADAGRIDPRLLEFDLDRLAGAIRPERDRDFQYLGVQTLYDRYLLHIDGRRIETPQYFWMRVAMGLALNEQERESRAIEFYELLSTFRFVSATPTLFNSGTLHPQLSSCYLTTVDDDLQHIFKCVQDNAMLSKWAGGLGNDWTRVRATGAHIHGTNGKSQGVIPFLKVANDGALAVNQGGKRKGAICAYLEPWHLDFEEFLELRKNTGDDRRRTHDMNTAAWVPDLFMRRVQENGEWTLFSPNDVPDLHDLYGEAFKSRYEHYEQQAELGEIKLFRRVEASKLWRKMLSMVFETGHPWLTFKDPSNLRSPQDHSGVVHSSNLCTEILLNTSNDETAVCNLGSINLVKHTGREGVDRGLLADTIRTAVRMLDNVIDINYYPTAESANANRRHRPVGLGLMGFQDALFVRRIPYGSQPAVEFADEVGELIGYHAILASAELAAERGRYGSYQGSKWDRGLLPIDTIDAVHSSRNEGEHEMDRTCRLGWAPVRQAVAAHGMRNSNVMAIAPTATISNIAGCAQSIEPTYRNLFAKSNLSGDFTIVNAYLVADLKRLELWDDQMIDELKHHDGELGPIDRVPEEVKRLYQTAFAVDPHFLIEANSRRQKWIDMGISFNLYLANPSGPALSDMYAKCWRKGLKTTYYLRSLAATQVEKSSIDVNRHGVQPKWMKSRSSSSEIVVQREPTPSACSIDDPECEACQ
ncbi:Ribonucleoside-diphosphate reductase 1 subunit alpha [Posidoniimonas corsicana]|uniref:Ribonucleoside-diphosphate reductase n=1 Tax=Posidoniimonas corsicana TaxID=1938618 RepID=A0A5C5VET2_9BACT|nr:ribonucleoside-diphosphate reductase subunit alpha [Posidoniimonas corsicana]TWT37144.1 Ribonucleoside-diphosphate reductase 1 subunit alpha [Posidoniimonas corsicana]